MGRLGVATLLALSLLGCGGKSSSSGEDGGSGNAGGTGAGGSGSKLRDCQVDGRTYKNGESFKAPDGCNSCGCDDGEISCTLIGCSVGSCAYDGETYDVGEMFTLPDGSACACVSDGAIECSVTSDDECYGLGANYQALLERAKSCDPEDASACTLLVDSALTCGCGTFVTPGGFSRDAVAVLQQEVVALACNQDGACGACPTPARGYCTPSGQCADLQQMAGARSCKVGGGVYFSGSSGIQDPFSCNQCSCEDGVLGCDEAACPKPCPENTKPGTSCAECGANDACLTVETGCMPVCVDTCAQGFCIDGLCVNYCG